MDLQEAFDAGFEAVKSYVDDAFAAFEARIKAIEAREPMMGPAGRDGIDGKDADPDPIADAVLERVLAAMRDIPAPKDGAPGERGADGKDADMSRVEALEAQVAELLAREMPVPVKGDPGEPGLPGRDGKDADPALIEALVLEKLAEAVSALPAPKNGEKGADGRDGVGVAGAVIDRDGALVLTLSDGTQRNLGPVVGRDGAQGERGERGADGKDGQDGIGFDDMTFEVRDEACYLVWEKGGTVKEARLPIPIDRGVWKDGAEYYRGNGVSWGGSFWLAQKDNPAGKPDSPNSDWRLATKRGQNAKGA